MSGLERLRSDMGFAGRRAYQVDEDQTEACLAVLDEFIAGHEVVEVYENPRLVCEPLGEGGFRQWHNDLRQDLSTARRETIIVPRDPEPRITDHTLTERMAVLEEELKERCGDLGRRVHLLEYRTAQKVAIATMAAEIKRDRPLLEAAEGLLNAMGEWGKQGEVVADAGDALSAAIKEERER